MFKAGRKRGGSKKQVIRTFFIRRNRNKTKMGGSAKKQLDKLQKMQREEERGRNVSQ